MWVIANIIYQIHNTIHGIDALLQNQFQKINFFFFYHRSISFDKNFYFCIRNIFHKVVMKISNNIVWGNLDKNQYNMD